MSSQEAILFSLIQNEAGNNFAASQQGWEQGSTNACDWYGITCNLAGQVVRISLTGFALQATLPPALGQLGSLRDLILSNCQLQGQIPRAIARMASLEQVDWTRNELTGTLPAFDSTRLRLHSLAHNQLTGTLPPSFVSTSLPDLITINYKNNQFTGPIPEFTADFPSFRELDLSHNQLMGTLPQSLVASKDNFLPILERLYVSENQLTGTLPESFMDDSSVSSSLQELILSQNQFTGTVPTSLALLPDLRVLQIQQNRLTGVLPEDLCDLDLNDDLFDDELPYATDNNGDTFNSGNQRHWQRRKLQYLTQRDGCLSIACPAGSRSDTGMFPCTRCDSVAANPYLGSAECREISQEEVLDIFFGATSGSKWRNNKSWNNANTPICSRLGITCDDEDSIVRLDLQDQLLSGSLPLELGFLTRLTGLDLSHNRLQGHIPEELALAPLKWLDVSENFLTGYVPGALCRKRGINGNGQDEIFNCDAIACRMGTFHPTGHADAGANGVDCQPCRLVDGMVLGNKNCGALPPTIDMGDDSGSTTFIQVFVVVILGFGLILAGVFVWYRSGTARGFFQSRYDQTAPDRDAENLAPAAAQTKKSEAATPEMANFQVPVNDE